MADRVRRVSFLVDLGAGTAEERAQVRLVLSRVLTHLSRQSPAPPRWSFRFYDSSLTPQRFDARMHARAKASAAWRKVSSSTIAVVRMKAGAHRP